MAVLTTYPMNYSFMGEGLTHQTRYSSHLCNYLKRTHVQDIPIIRGMMLIEDSEFPQMAALWGGCLSFSKCHAERRAPNDKHMNWVFWGEEYLRSMQLWTRGYDLYSPSKYGHVVFHNWSDDKGMKKRFWDNVTQVMTREEHDMEEKLAYNRLRMVLTLPFNGPVDAQEIDKFHGGKVRSVEQFLQFSGISNTNPALDEFRCEQLHWVPYAIPEIIEEFLPGWRMRPALQSNGGLLNATDDMPNSVNGSWREREKDLIQRVLDKLEALQTPNAESSQMLHEIQRDVSLLTHPHQSMWPLAFVWLGMLSVWLIFRRTRSPYAPVPTTAGA
ncbi:hypothetical protein, variant 2 [Aphanomyces invadans]|nr:hypothetical protein, variant 1 [Aphanomyces invadans]XP_008871909.1 hypothetical protein, variant 2 [Aphanomyces invadans]ETV99352.1 hypothetical protein, variant 1 [Aphanomyces invadans]ETV99353.1 hypothetical protein, variant 2 [Aphanomyces invadans]|eukprot:XP_008871908.1 hypothetical protein, variant 1 [Aphanomyces invadans]